MSREARIGNTHHRQESGVTCPHAAVGQMEVIVAYESRCLAGILLIVLPTVMFGGASILSLLMGDPTYMQNALRQDLWRAGHAHAGVWLILALVALRYVDEANLSYVLK